MALLCCGGSLRAGERPAETDVRSPVVVSLAGSHDGTLQVTGRFTIAVPHRIAWEVLTDYDHIPQFVPSMKASRVIGHTDGALLVEQTSVGRLLFFERTYRVVLRVREEAPRAIVFTDTSRTSFERYEGTWSLNDAPTGVEIVYRLTAKDGLATGAAMRGASRHMVEDLLERVRAEISARARKATPPAGA
jgi:ribosome-associated toxin RatA of RatAB toxin-antitoxin module